MRCQSRKFGYEIDPFSKLGIFSNKQTMLAASRYGSGLKSTPLTTEKIAVFAPMPSASVTIAIAAKEDEFFRDRNP